MPSPISGSWQAKKLEQVELKDLQRITDYTLARPEACRVSFNYTDAKTQKTVHREYNVVRKGNKFTVENAVLWRRFMAKLGIGGGISKGLSTQLDSYFPYRKEPAEDEVFQLSPHRFHHQNVMSIDVLPEHIDSEKPLIVLDVDETLLVLGTKFDKTQKRYTPIKQVDRVLGQDFEKLVTTLQNRCPQANILLMTNASRGTREKFMLANMTLSDSVIISERDPKISDDADKGKRLARFLDDSGIQCDSVHFVDDVKGNLDQLAAETERRELPCHTYEFIGALDQSHYKWVIQESPKQQADMVKFYREYQGATERLAAMNVLRSRSKG